ncbi:uncharacterized protein L201_000465 [Kwoniella dendrophila CBS 6074]|uniref:Uncharacterized protein n=1 Tax=Kwoniella dendrophila CBS 6074 TaxID=1295534 RepID=A0AAX4JJK6_9TREE
MFGPIILLLIAFVQTALSVDHLGYEDPCIHGGSMLTYTPETTPANLGEPLNIIISNQSDPRVLVETMAEGGLYNYLEAAAFGGQCLGLHMGVEQQANLGDGYSNQTQRSILRYQYFHDPFLGTCLESIYGGNHLRVFKQDSTGAYFLSSSSEKDSKKNHALGVKGDLFIGNTTNMPINVQPNADTILTGQSAKRGWTYTTTVKYVDDLLPSNRKAEWNHYMEVQAIGDEVSDRLVAVLTIQMTKDDPRYLSEHVWSAIGL